MHLAAALRTLDGHGVDVGSVQFNILRTVRRHFLQFCDRADRVEMTAGALPDVERSAPVTVAGDRPVLDVLKPVAEASLPDCFGNPVYRVIVPYQIVADRGFADVP